jgi:GAF domain-containing protein
LRRRSHAEILERTRAVIRGLQPSEALQRVVNLLHDSMDHYTWVGIYLLEGEDLVLAAWRGPQATEHVRIPVGQGICGLAAQTAQVVNVPDVRKDPRYLMCFPSTRSELVVPIVGSRGVLGEIDVDSDELAAFDGDDEEFLRSVADDLARMLEAGDR